MCPSITKTDTFCWFCLKYGRLSFTPCTMMLHVATPVREGVPSSVAMRVTVICPDRPNASRSSKTVTMPVSMPIVILLAL